MKMLTAAALICTIMALTRADAETHLVKRTHECSDGLTEINGRHFVLVSEPLPWAKAEEKCQNMSGNLASVHNDQEYHEIQKLIRIYCQGYRETWIGGHDGEQEGIWLWSDGKKFNYWTWCHGEPNNRGGGQHCLQMNYSDKKCWDDDMCSKHKPSVCVKRG